MKDSTKEIFDSFFQHNVALTNCSVSIINFFDTILDCFSRGNVLFLCGNGGSAADCGHIQGELVKSFKLKREPSQDEIILLKDSDLSDKEVSLLENGLPVIDLCAFGPLISAISNDGAPEHIFGQQVWAMGKKGDCLLAISTSGNSKNVVLAAKIAKAKGMKVLALVGENTMSQLNLIANYTVNVPKKEETFMVQELHLPVYHALCLALENELYGDEE